MAKGEENCIVCGTWLDPEWCEAKNRFCSRSCLNKDYYERKKEYHQKLYLKARRDWEKSSVGKRAGLAFWKWRLLPKYFKE